jgi:hypothetical protein
MHKGLRLAGDTTCSCCDNKVLNNNSVLCKVCLDRGRELIDREMRIGDVVVIGEIGSGYSVGRDG